MEGQKEATSEVIDGYRNPKSFAGFKLLGEKSRNENPGLQVRLLPLQRLEYYVLPHRASCYHHSTARPHFRRKQTIVKF